MLIKDTKTSQYLLNQLAALEAAVLNDNYEVAYNLATRVKDTVVLMQEAGLAGKPMPK